jgi:hypothetical protein
MFRRRRKHAVVIAGASVLIGLGTLVAVPLTASAQPVGTSLAVVTHPSATTSGHPLLIVAKITTGVTVDATTAAVRNGRVVPTGTVSFNIVGADSSTIPCENAVAVTSNAVTVKHKRANCKVAAEELQAVNSPYTITATYSGDSNFSGSSSLPVTEIVTKAKSHIRLRHSVKPMSELAVTFNAYVSSGRVAGSLVSGTVLFAVSDTPATLKSKRTCLGGDVQPIVVSGNVGVASCVLEAGWFVVPSPTKAMPHPKGAWNVTASYSGDKNFNPPKKPASNSGVSRT